MPDLYVCCCNLPAVQLKDLERQCAEARSSIEAATHNQAPLVEQRDGLVSQRQAARQAAMQQEAGLDAQIR